MSTRENPSGVSLVLLAAGAGVAYYYWKKKKTQQELLGEAQLGLQILSEQGPMSTSVTGLRDDTQSTTDKWTWARAAEADQAAAEAEAAQPQNWFESGVDAVFPGLHEEIR